MALSLIARFVYGLIGVAFVVASAAVLLFGTGLLPAAIADIILEFGNNGDANTMHLLQEYCTLMLVVGVVHLWCVRNYDRSRFFHWVLTVFWALFALIHWFDFRGTFHADLGRGVITLPFVVFLLMGILRERLEGQRRGEERPVLTAPV